MKSNEKPTYEKDIKPLFREFDRTGMEFRFDLWSYAEVKKRAPEILRRLSAGRMPCDGPWPAEKVDVLRRWIDAGMPN